MLKGKNAIITGARRGIGRATVEVFAKNGANIWACARAKDEAFEADMSRLAEKYGVWIKPVFFEMTDSAQIKEAVNIIRKDKQPIDVLVNNAGMSYDALLPMLSIDKTRELFEVNFFSHVQLTQLISRIMMRQKSGCIINTSSYLAEDGNKGQSMYSASKAAMSAFTRSLAKEFSEYGIRVNAVAPGVVDTELIQTMTEDDMSNVMQKVCLHRPASPTEIGNVIAMLASDMSSYVNGQIIRIDGGI